MAMVQFPVVDDPHDKPHDMRPGLERECSERRSWYRDLLLWMRHLFWDFSSRLQARSLLRKPSR